MASVAKVTLIGNLGKDPELRYTPDGMAVCTLSVATTQGVKVKGEWENVTTWFRVTCWRQIAERATKDLSKGSPVYVEGTLTQEKWTDKDENERTTLAVNASDVQSLEYNTREKNEREEEPEVKTKTKVKAVGEDQDIPF